MTIKEAQKPTVKELREIISYLKSFYGNYNFFQTPKKILIVCRALEMFLDNAETAKKEKVKK